MSDQSDTINIPGYQVLRTLGSGGMAKVYLAVQESFGRQVALKIMSPLLNSDPSFAARFMREARIVAQIHHSSIVPVFDVGQHESLHYLSMEHLPGGDLKQVIKSDGGNTAQAIAVCTAISSALDLAHRKGFVHRDIKPENILFREDRTPVLTDFGIARAFHANATQTVAGMLVGTPAYMSPEQVKGMELDARTDLYSLGIVFYEMLTGTVPFHSDSSVSVAVKHLNDVIPPLPPQFAGFQSFVDKLTAKDREHRYSSGLEVIEALKELGAASAVQLTVRRPRLNVENPTPPAPALAPPPLVKTGGFKLDKRWGIGIGAVALSTLVIGAELLFGGPRNGIANIQKPVTDTPAQTAAVTPPADEPSQPAIPTENASTVPAAVNVAPPANTTVEPVSNRPAPAAMVADAAPKAMRPAVAEMDPVAKRKEIERLLSAADEEYIRGSLIEPKGANAREHYQAVLKLQPNHPDALDGLQRVNEVLASKGRTNNGLDSVSAQTNGPVTIVEPGYGRRPYNLRNRLRERRAERDTAPPQYDGKIDVPTPNVPAPSFNGH